MGGWWRTRKWPQSSKGIDFLGSKRDNELRSEKMENESQIYEITEEFTHTNNRDEIISDTFNRLGFQKGGEDIEQQYFNLGVEP